MARLLAEIGHEIRRSRIVRGLTQAQLAKSAGLTRTTLNQLENGLITDLGVRKVQAILDELGLTLVVERTAEAKGSDFLRVASTAASVSFKTPLTERELLHTLLTGKVPANRRAHLRALLEEAPPPVLNGLVQQVTRWAKPGKVEMNLSKIAASLGLPEGTITWSIR